MTTCTLCRWWMLLGTWVGMRLNTRNTKKGGRMMMRVSRNGLRQPQEGQVIRDRTRSQMGSQRWEVAWSVLIIHLDIWRSTMREARKRDQAWEMEKCTKKLIGESIIRLLGLKAKTIHSLLILTRIMSNIRHPLKNRISIRNLWVL
jgi:hypothetical protein